MTFDAGMTLIELDLDFLARRLGERGRVVDPDRLRAAAPAAWRRYDEQADAGAHHGLWQALIHDIVGHDVPRADIDWLWEQQPTRNLFRLPIADMVALAYELRAAGVRTAIVSNSEGGLADLLAEVQIADAFEVILDSQRVGIEKPDPRIFEVALDRLGDRSMPRVHIGDSYTADVAGALAAGWNAVWYGRRAVPVADPRIAIATDAATTRAALSSFGV